MNIIIKEIHKKDKSAIKSLIAKNKYNPYANLGFYRDVDRLNNYYYGLFFAGRNIKVLSAIHRNEIVGLLTFSISKWDSEVFGMKMAKLGYITAIGNYAVELAVKSKLIDNAIKHLRKQNTKHLLIRVASNDFSSIHALENNGFKIMDNLLTFILRERRIIFPEVERWFKVKKITKGELESAGDILTNSNFVGHYFVDPMIPVLKAKRMYRKWLEDKYEHPKDSDILVAKRRNKIVGCSFFSFNNLLKKYTGLETLHRGLIAVDPSAKGCSIALINAQIKRRKNLDFAEFETQTYNYGMMDIIQRLNMRLIRSRYTFHKVIK